MATNIPIAVDHTSSSGLGALQSNVSSYLHSPFINHVVQLGHVKTPRVALIGNYLPQRCGLATFTFDTRVSLINHSAQPQVDSYILHDADGLQYPPEVSRLINRDKRSDYRAAGQQISRSKADIVLLQHEFGIFGGDDGCYVLDLLDAVSVPVVSTLHTVLEHPSAAQSGIMQRLIDASDLLVVMADFGRDVLRRCYGVPANKIAVISHGIPDFAYTDPALSKPQFGFGERPVVLTFGLLSHDKGIDRMIDALPEIVQQHPDVLYVVLGATHPNLVAEQGETLRWSLQKRAEALGVADNIALIDEFVELGTLIEYIRAADVYVTPYLNPMQITSGTLSYAVGLGKPVVSTPYVHAAELLVEGNGVLVPFDDSTALASEITKLLHDHEKRQTMAKTAYARGRTMVWERSAQNLLDRFGAILDRQEQSSADQTVSLNAA